MPVLSLNTLLSNFCSFWVSLKRQVAVKIVFQEKRHKTLNHERKVHTREIELQASRVRAIGCFWGGVKPALRTRISRRMQEEEETYMLVMAELDGAIEIDEDEVYRV
ncbi:hypothetical protein B0H14DRAFT_2580905 [Mycena olivaceomarginata]|nr:hypothetical protein B0H14DRAFT_2580905 [Mycena olivaceomarginata]